ncbi:MAG: hypothetical protein COX90_01440 [Candidatus Nealsonbacteria bacterium CG_4_10_14_0_2_um_filter_38_17]|uniref:DOD-type homing endonuclease domain-containing protein n=1 Tax=Candidatus Nealsonbacteria bacterium CG_4_10_14_0_2_um_filter_38_17 TaxID=1974680 RepID=A0A2M7UYS1_9BACT|nr:MAG: hypothetical protein COX90_01440 [Candidatus Nealsonbacteria bacterium CG_4_10_14_0_2_um_filter_38_17]
MIKRDTLGRFVKGIDPWNKGTVGICKGNKTFFKKGHNWPKYIERKRIVKLYRCNPNLRLTENLAYLLGTLKGDGYVNYSKKYNRYIIGLQNTKLKFCKEFFNVLRAINLNPSLGQNKKIKGVGKHKLYFVVANSQVFYRWYKKLSLPKLKRLLSTKRMKISFIKGFYESEGTIFKRKDKKYHLAFINTNGNLLRVVKTLLNEIGFNLNLNGPYKATGLGKKPRYHLQTSKQQQIKKFITTINPSIKKAF